MWSTRHLRGPALLVTTAMLVTAWLAVPGIEPAAAGRGRTQVVASFYPLTWATRVVGGSGLQLSDLTPAGAEPHDLELTTDDRDLIEDADLVVVLGGGFQSSIEDAAAQRDGSTFDVIAALSPAQRRRAQRDPHVWLDPLVMRDVVDQIAQRLARVDPLNADKYRRRAAGTHARLDELDLAFRRGLAQCERTLVVTAHEAFGWLTSRYGLRQEGVAGIDPEQEPDPDRLAKLADLARREGVTTVFTETLVSTEVAETLAREAGGLRTEVLSPLESLAPSERARGDDYVDVMRANLEKLRAALGCE